LSTFPGFAGLGTDELALIAEHARERTFRAGEVVLVRGEPVGSLYLVVDGRLRVEGGGRGQPFVGPREGVGLLSLLSRSPDGVGAVADLDTVTLAFDGDEILDLFEDNFSLLLFQVRKLAAMLLEERKRTADGVFFGAREGMFCCPDHQLDLVQRIVLLRESGPFARSSLGGLASIVAQMEEVRFDAGSTLWRSGEPSGSLLLTLDGVIGCKIGESGHVFHAGRGYPLGNLESLTQEPRWYDAVVENPLIALRGDSGLFLDVLEDHTGMAMDFLAAMAANAMTVLQDRAQPAVL
jgi:CRP-like cAMP-binding protein